MVRKLQLLATVALFTVSPRTLAEEPPTAAQPPPPSAAPAAAPAPEWTSMSRARVAQPLPARAPMALELGARPPPAKWTDVPVPPPPAQAQKSAAPARGKGAKAPSARTANGPLAAAAVAPAPAIFAPQATPAVAEAPPVAAPAALEASPPPAWAPSVYEAPGAAQGGNPNEPKVKFAADQTGVMMSVTQDLESDKVRQSWAQTGGTIQAYEANAGAMFMYKDLSGDMGEGAYMSGVGLNGGVRMSILNLTAPKYETRDTSWTAFKIGGGADVGAMGVTISTPVECYPYVGCVGGTTNASMSSFTLVGTLGVMKAFGSFDSPREWSGWAVGAEWAPSYQSTTLTMEGADPQTSSSFNATGFAFNFESGSLQSMAAKMGKKAHLKMRLFVLPAVGDMPLLMTVSVGAVWY